MGAAAFLIPAAVPRRTSEPAMTTRHAIRAAVLLALPVVVAACAPRTAGVEARREADERFRRTTSLVNYDQARQAFESGDLAKARKELDAAIARSEGEARYWCLYGRVELESKRLERAIEMFDAAIARDPKLAEAHYYRGIVHQRWSEADAAIADYLAATDADAEKLAYPLAAAELMVSERRLGDARALLQSKLAYFEHNAALHELLGDVASLEGDMASAARSYERALVIAPDAPLLSEKVVGAYFGAGEWQRSLDAARRMREGAVRSAGGVRAEIPNDVLRHEGRSLAMLGRMAEAKSVFADETRHYPEDAEAWRDYATACLATGDTTRAEAAAERVVALSADDFRGYMLRGFVADRAGRADEAVRWHRLSVARAAGDLDARVALGLALRAAGRRAESLEILGAALKDDPASTVARKAFADASE